ncbi:lipoyl domain-containing protein [Streptomyces sp. NPDC031705]|uniref:lipoyl domain-containing protein n=1 Tax=unclassified Streptomyces TaxID=2593676 RepID=UPI0033DEE5DE
MNHPENTAAPARLAPVVLEQITANDDVYYLLEWLVPEGGMVAAGEVIFSVESSKSIEDVEARHTGRVVDRVEAAAEYAVGQTLARIELTD